MTKCKQRPRRNQLRQNAAAQAGTKTASSRQQARTSRNGATTASGAWISGALLTWFTWNV